MEHKVITSSSASGLNEKISKYINEGFRPIGGHSAVVVHSQNRYSGSQHMDTENRLEYSQTVVKDIEDKYEQGVMSDPT